MTNSQNHYSARDIENRILSALQEAGLNPANTLTPLELGALDHFHTGGYQSSVILQELSNIRASDRVLDIGAGLAGAARMLAASPGCQVDCIELSDDYCVGAELLNRLTGLQDQVKILKGSATDMLFHDNIFDVAWMQNVGMNIQDKQKLYAEIGRVLKPGGRFAFQEMIYGDAGSLDFPLPWAKDPSDNFLISANEMKKMLEELGFVAEYFEDVSDTQFNPSTNSSADNIPQVSLSLSTYVDDLAVKAENAQRNLKDGRVRFYRGVFVLNG
jgi:SAM-dependent methyltransferase